MNLSKTAIHIGLQKPIRVLHISDTHLTLADKRDNDRKRLVSINRKPAFDDVNGSVERYLDEQISYGHENCDLILHTGDLIDFVSIANVEKAGQILKDDKILFIAGNHEYSQYVDEAWEDHAYRMNAYMHIRGTMGVDMLFASRVVGDVNFVCVDNGYYQFEDWQLKRLKMEVAKGLPVILAFHNPLFQQQLFDSLMKKNNNRCADIVGCSEENLLPYEEYRALQQRPNRDTLHFIEYIGEEPLIKAVLAGHLHESSEGMLPCGKMQYIVGGGFKNIAREIIID